MATDDSPSPYFFIERFGRRKMLMSSAAACCFCMTMISIMLALNNTAVGPVVFSYQVPHGLPIVDNRILHSLNGHL